MNKLTITYRKVAELVPYARNSRTHNEEQIKELAISIRTFGFNNPVLIDAAGIIIAGHGRLLGAAEAGLDEVPTITLGHLTEQEKRAYVIADNKLATKAGWDLEMLTLELNELVLAGFDAQITGFDADELEKLLTNEDFLPPPLAQMQQNPQSNGSQGGENEDENSRSGAGNLSTKFITPPFSVLNAREGWWISRKKAWISLGIRSELGRTAQVLKGKEATGDGLHHYRKKRGKVREDYKKNATTGTSIFDPVLCELVYRWFCPKGGAVNDCFAGGSVRGIVAAKLGLKYRGVDLSQAQVDANIEQAEHIIQPSEPMPEWTCGDSSVFSEIIPEKSDLLFTCPPYADLEVYSDDEADLSNMGYDAFREVYRHIIKEACGQLKSNRFAVVVVGDVRDKQTGFYYGFVQDTVRAFEDAGLHLYNEAILVTVAGSLPLRAGRQFSHSRKLGKTHQNVLVFIKGDPVKATEACGVVDTFEVLGEEED